MCFSSQMSFQSLCPSKRETIFLNLDLEYEYRPDHYEEVICAGRSIVEEDPFHRPVNIIFGTHRKPTTTKTILIFSPTIIPRKLPQVCSEAGFSCIQLNRTLFLTRRVRGMGCWESETRIVPAGCECMWPKHNLGDISAHH